MPHGIMKADCLRTEIV